jgi:hypothetical protein
MSRLKDYEHLNWRDSGLKAGLGLIFVNVDGIILIPWLVSLFTLNMNIALGSLLLTIALAVLKLLGMDLKTAIKKTRSYVAGKDRFIRDTKKRKRRLFK